MTLQGQFYYKAGKCLNCKSGKLEKVPQGVRVPGVRGSLVSRYGLLESWANRHWSDINKSLVQYQNSYKACAAIERPLQSVLYYYIC